MNLRVYKKLYFLFFRNFKQFLVLFFAYTGFFASFSSCKSQCHAIAAPKADVKPVLKKVADWQIRHFKYSTATNVHDNAANAWTNATLYVGMFEWAKIASDSTYYQWLKNMGEVNQWKIAANFVNYPKYQMYHADELCAGQFYLAMFDAFGEEKMIQSTKERVDYIMSNPPDTAMNMPNKQSWTWCDALFMAPAVYVRMAMIEGDDRYLQFMDREFKRTYQYLYNKENKLFFRDSSYMNKTEANGKKIFWGRGNGWVAAGLVNILKILPQNSTYRPFYEELFCEFLPRLATLQSSDGFWRASLLDPDSYPAPESSATALITYALAYGVNNGLLDKNSYAPIVEKSWRALLSVIDTGGKFGYVQSIGADPKKVTANMTAAYGIGAFLLAGTEIDIFYSKFIKK